MCKFSCSIWPFLSVNWKMLVNSMSWMSEKCRQRSYKFMETIWGIHFILKAWLVPIFVSLFLPLFSFSFGLHILSSHTRCLLHCFLIGMAHIDLHIRTLWEQIRNLLVSKDQMQTTALSLPAGNPRLRSTEVGVGVCGVILVSN